MTHRIQDIPDDTAYSRIFIKQEGGLMNLFIDSDIQMKEGIQLFPISLAQQHFWFFDQLEPATTVYNIISHMHLQFSLDIHIFKQSLDAIIQRHEVLRTAIMVIDGQPQQTITGSLTLSLPVVELQHLSKTERDTQVLRLATEEAQRPFDVSQAPLIRTTLLKLGHEDYLLFLSLHSIISDAWSIRLFYQELATLYEAFLNGRPSPLVSLPLQYTDVTRWQKEWLQGATASEHAAYWKTQLEHTPAALSLPIDHLRPATRTYHGAVHQFTLSKSLTDNLKALSRQEGVLLYTTLVAAFEVLVHRYTGQDDLLLGSPIDGRDQPETEKLIGPFANTLVLRTNLSGNPTFRELLGRENMVMRDASMHQSIPFEFLIDELQIEHNVAQSPLFQIALSLEPSPPILPPGWTLTRLHIETNTSKFDLSLELEEQPEGLIGRFEYTTDLFDAATVDRMVGHWRTLLESIVNDPAKPLGELPLLTKTEQHQLLMEWNTTDIEYSRDKCIHQVFEAQVVRTPDAVAVVFEEKSLTYMELNRKANQLAHFLQKQGVRPEVSVGIYVERSLEMVVALLGILKAGGAYVPLDLTYPIDRLTFMLADTQAPVLCSQQQFITKLPNYEGRIVCLDTDWEKIAQESEANPDSTATGENLAYVIYTSGSTGKPKGVLINHASAVHLFDATRSLFHFDARDVWSLFHSYAFDFSVWELWGPLLSGGRLVVVPYWVSRSSEAFYALLRTEQVTILNQCPSAFHQLIRVEESSGAPRSLALRLVIFGCEAFEVQSLKPWVDRQGDQAPQLVVMYGPTETTVFVTYYPLTTADLELASGSVIGRPIPGSQIYILDAYQQPVPVGVPGEIYIGGTGLARGYLHRPELTAERFVSNPLSRNADARLYKTGDLARYMLNGNVEFLGRIDDQVKIRGFRVELGEIDAVLSQHPSVAQEVVVVREDIPGDKRLVAYVVVTQGQTLTIKTLRSYLAERLPAYMVPSAFMVLDTLPLTHNSKIDRRALPIPQQTERTTEETYVPPTSIVHSHLIQIWEELLDTRPVGIRDNFFTLGGYSLLAARMVNQFEQVSGRKIPLATLFAGPTIEQLDNALMDEEKVSSYPLVAVRTDGTRNPFFFLHGDWTRGAFYCFTLAGMLGKEQPFYVLEPYRVDGIHIPATFEDMAAQHVASLRAFQPAGPYLLGGFCNGGLLAYEMARQLHAEGQNVDLLFLIGPAQPAYLGLLRIVINRVGRLMRCSQEKQANWFLGLRHVLRHLYRYLHSSNDARLQDFAQLLQIDARLDRMFPPVEALRKDYVGIFTWLAAGYAPTRYPGKITFLWASEEPATEVAWRDIAEANEVESYVISGTLMSSLTEQVHTLAKHLSTCLSKAQSAMLSK